MTTITAQPTTPRLAPPRVSGARAAIARRATEIIARRVPVNMLLPDGALLGGGVPRAGEPTLQIVDPSALFARLADDPKIGVGEGYMAGEWLTGAGTDLADLLVPFAERADRLLPSGLLRLRRLVDRPIPTAQRNTPDGSRRNIEAHYDLSNDLFASFLDETLTYSSALFDSALPWSQQSLASAQLRKVNAILDLARVRSGATVLEIGTGWGTLAIEAARRGAHVTTLTLSAEQAALAQARVDAAGLTSSVDIRLQDYRDVAGQYDAIVSVEMIEAVGEEFWPTYFEVLQQRLAPGGIAAIQAILMSHDRYRATRNSYGWIQKHIFPGGLIPSLQAIDETTARYTDLRITGVHAFGAHYAETLRRWRRTFDGRWPQISGLGFDETFRRMWEFYLAYCEAGFTSGYLDVAHIRLERRGAQ